MEALQSQLATIAQNEKIKINADALKLLAEHAQGSLRDALSLLGQLASLGQKIDAALVENILGLPPQAIIENLLQALLGNQIQDLIKAYRELSGQGVDPVVLTSRLTQTLREDLRNNPKDGRYIDKINLLEDLLDVFSSKQPQATLEIILLKHAQTIKSPKK